MSTTLFARVIQAEDAGATIDRSNISPSFFQATMNLHTGMDFGVDRTLPEPFERVVIMPEVAAYRGQIIGIVTGSEWRHLDEVIPYIPQRITTPLAPDIDEHVDTYDTTEGIDTSETHEIVEGIYQTGLQLHAPDAPLWAEAVPSGKGVVVTVPCQWPAHVRASVAQILEIPIRSVHLNCRAPSGNRDGAVTIPAILSSLCAHLSMRLDSAVRIALRYDQSFLSGGRAPGRVMWASRLAEDGTLLSNAIKSSVNLGAYATFEDELKARMRIAASSIYQTVPTEYHVELKTTADVPMAAFEGVGSAQLSFAREVHINRLAEVAGYDPIVWRQKHVRRDWPIVKEIFTTLAREADFHRRYSANELVKKRRTQLSLDSSSLRGIGFAMAQQQSGMTGDRETGSITVRLNQDGSAEVFCSIPTPTHRLQNAWRQIVAQELDIDIDAVTLDTTYDSNQHDSGPRLFSRGVSLVPRAILLACQAIQKQRFREPLPITVKRTIRPGKGMRTPVDALRSIGAVAVEAILHPTSMEIDVRSITMVIYAGKILDRGMAEAELRRGIYHALNWTLHESLIDAELVTEPDTMRSYNTAFRGNVPRIKIVFLNQIRKDGPVGIGEIPFNTIPAALVSALSQATGLYLDSLPVRPGNILRQLQEE